MHVEDDDRKLRPPPLKSTRGSPAAGTTEMVPRGSVAKELHAKPQHGLGASSTGGCNSSAFAAGELPKVSVSNVQHQTGEEPEHGLVASRVEDMVDVAPVAPVALVGEARWDRKKHRDMLRATAHRNQQPYPACYNPQGYLEVPKICNRIATDWGKDPAGCMCAMQWPQFLAAAYSSGQAKRVQSAVCYDGELTLPAFLHEDVHQVDPEEEEAEEEGEPEEDEEEEAEEDAEGEEPEEDEEQEQQQRRAVASATTGTTRL